MGDYNPASVLNVTRFGATFNADGSLGPTTVDYTLTLPSGITNTHTAAIEPDDTLKQELLNLYQSQLAGLAQQEGVTPQPPPPPPAPEEPAPAPS